MGEAVSDVTVRTHRPMSDRFRDVRRKLDAISAEHPDFGETLNQSLEIVRRALDEFGGSTGCEGLAISFNGGKDACVVLYLLLLVLAERDQLHLLSNKGIPVVYFVKDEFPEMEAFMEDVSRSHGFEFLKYPLSYKDGMRDLVDSHGVKGVIMGQRRGDPWTETMQAFTPSTPGWAEFIRVNPALEWKFSHVWRFLRGSGLPYCRLYDEGYTSLGERGDTAKNEALRLPNGEYRPAYELAENEEHLERSPRSSSAGEGGGAVDGGDGNGEGVGQGRGAPCSPVESKAFNRPSSWDSSWNSLDDPNRVADLKRGVLKGARVGVEAGRTARGPPGALVNLGGEVAVADAAVAVGGEAARNRGGDGVPSCKNGEVLDLNVGGAACVQTARNDRGMPTGWVGGSVRWLPLTAVAGLMLAAVLRK